MADLEIKENNVFTDNGYNFIPVGDPQKIFGKTGILHALRKRIFDRDQEEDISGFWATIGRADNKAILPAWSGKIYCSRNGNVDFSNQMDLVKQEINFIRNAYPELSLNPNSFTERYISLDEVRFGSEKGAQDLRLTVMVKPTEHAVVFIQFTDAEEDWTRTDAEGITQYLVPEEPEDLGRLDRLDYYFKVPSIPGKMHTRFVIKVLTFPRPYQSAVSTRDVKSVFKGLDNPYNFVMYKIHSDGNPAFIHVEPGDIDRSKKTLFLFHGTFSTVHGSFGDLLSNGWCQQVIDRGHYEQIIGFDHYTMVASPQDNAAEFLGRLSTHGKFTKTASMITTSRGGLVGKCILNTKDQDLITFERAATVACANGVEYFDTAENVGKFLSFMSKRSASIPAKIILGALQFGIKKFVEQPGLKAMKKGNRDLQSILNDVPKNNQLRYYPICGDYNPAQDNANFKIKALGLLVDGIIKNRYNDWVVETDYQVIMPEGYLAYGKPASYYRSRSVNSIHTEYFDVNSPDETKDRIFEFLHDPASVL